MSGAIKVPHDLSELTGTLPASQGGVPAGGTTGQVLSKASGTDRDAHWVDPAAGGVSSVNGLTGDVTLSKINVGLDQVDNTSDAAKPVSADTQNALDAKLAKASNLSDLGNAATARTNLGLGNVDNTSDANKPVSSAAQTALNAKAPLASPTFTGTPAAPTAASGTNTTQLATCAFVQSAVSGAAAYDPNAPLVLQFPAGKYCHVNHGPFWTPGTTYNNAYFYEAWVCLTDVTDTCYLVSDGHGGSHALLWGYSAGSPTGNCWNGTGSINLSSFGGDDVVNAGEWHHYAVGWDTSNIFAYLNGVPCGVSAFTSTTNTTGRVGGEGQFYVAGSDHLRFEGKVATMRGIEGAFPFDNVRAAFRPELFFGVAPGGQDQAAKVAILADYMTPGVIIADHSPEGFGGKRHPGRLFNTTNGLDIYHTNSPGSTLPVPSWVKDANCPLVRGASSLPASWGEAARTPAAVPSGAVVFDSFERRNNTWAHSNAPSLGSTEGGSAGVQAWTPSTGSVWGVLYGYAVHLSDNSPSNAVWNFVPTGISDQKVVVTRRKGTWGSGESGVAFRTVDASNTLLVSARADGGVRLVQVVSGTASDVQAWAPTNSGWTTLTVTAKGTSITVITDLETLGTVTSSQFQTATGAGLANATDYASTMGGLARWDNFTVFNAP